MLVVAFLDTHPPMIGEVFKELTEFKRVNQKRAAVGALIERAAMIDQFLPFRDLSFYTTEPVKRFWETTDVWSTLPDDAPEGFTMPDTHIKQFAEILHAFSDPPIGKNTRIDIVGTLVGYCKRYGHLFDMASQEQTVHIWEEQPSRTFNSEWLILYEQGDDA